MSTLDVLQSGEALTNKRNSRELFYWLKITGVPYYFFAVYNPTSTRFGSAAWTLPAGYTAVGGMDLPDCDLQQSLNDIIGGVATAERMRLTLTDFRAFDAHGEYKFLSRLFSPGIATSTPGGYFELKSDIPASMTTGGTVTLRASVRPDNGFYAVGAETLELSGWTGPTLGVSDGTIVGGRNRFPCCATYPPIPYHRVVRNETDGAAIGKNILVTPYGTPFTMIGRTAAFYIGAMGPNGQPLPEAQGLMRMVGRISGVDFGDVGAGGGGGATYQIELTSLVDDLEGAVAAPGLGIARIKDDQILLPASANSIARGGDTWLSCMLTISATFGDKSARQFPVVLDGSDVPDGNYTLELLLRKINDAFGALFATGWDPNLHAATITGDDGLLHVAIDAASAITGINAPLTSGPALKFTLTSGVSSFLAALGFHVDPYDGIKVELDQELPVFSSDPNIKSILRGVAEKPAPNVFIPGTAADYSDPSRFAIKGQDGSTSQYFFTDQGDGRAFVQLGDGTVMNLTAVDSTGGAHLTVGERWRWSQGTRQLINEESPETFYYVGWGSRATVRQVVVAGDRNADTDAGLLVGRFLASHDEASALDDLNYYPEGVGLGWNQILDGDSVRAIASYGRSYPREIVVDSSTKLFDILMPIIKAYGLGMAWDPELAKVSFRPLRTPAAPGAHAIMFSESNRADEKDRTSQHIDQANVRTSWTLNWGWDMVEKKFVAPPITLIDNIVQSAGAYQKDEKFEDKTLWYKADLDGIEYLNSLVFSRDYLYQQPWMKCDRTVNCAVLTLAPGSYHQIIDNTLINPFTGRLGITASDGLYALVMSVSANPYNMKSGKVTVLINRTRKSGLYRSWSPCGLVDYAAAGHGYATGTGVLTMARQYSSHATNKDGWDFVVGDTVRMLARHAVNGAFVYDQTTTVLAVAADGSTVTVASGLPAVADGTEILLVLRDYANATTARKAAVAFQGDSTTMIIESVAGAELHRWG